MINFGLLLSEHGGEERTSLWVVFVFVRRAPEHFSLVFVFVEMFACTAMAEDPVRLRRDRYSEYSIAATCRQALD